MSKENLERFMTQVADSEDLQAKIGEEITGDALVALGAAHGCEFSAEDLAADAELSDQELDGVAGGASFVMYPPLVKQNDTKFRYQVGNNTFLPWHRGY
jgi:predicted ribosomally synthesized peptide with nif11-like leader